MSVREALARLVGGHHLTRDEARAAMQSLVEGEATPSQIAGFAVALRMNGETAEEIAGLAEVMRAAATRVDAGEDVVDLVGTGGDGSRTFNISTLSAFVVAAAGGKVAKHGNRGVTSACGSADFLEALGIAIDLPPDAVAYCVREAGFGFMFAPLYHPAMRHAVVPRREIGVRTVFNILGPLANPAGAKRQLTGVAVPGLGDTLADVLTLLGSRHAMIVHGEDGLDEISIAAPTLVHETRDGERRAYTITPEQFGLARASTDEVRGGTVEANMALADAVLAGERGAARDVVLLNAGAGLYVAGIAASLEEGIQQAGIEIDSGRVRTAIARAVETARVAVARTASAVHGDANP
ncbi:MAG: anthranilate phosphoribosyltransferase [Chloroflexi bacterium]|nr:anthranilate phosphoribosyltransferase [Chloroflexota bacterium]